jgi:hypothetical protein
MYAKGSGSSAVAGKNGTRSGEASEDVAPSGVLSPPHGVDPNWAEKIVASCEAREMGAKLH